MVKTVRSQSLWHNSLHGPRQAFQGTIDLFLRRVRAAFSAGCRRYLDPTSLEFLDKEVFTDVTAGEKREVDLLVKARFQGQETFFLVHVENQSKTQADFPKRMFTYFARLYEKYNLPIYPVVLYSHNAPKRPEPHSHQVAFPGKTVLQFDYVVIQLNRLSWRDYLSKPNPVASALMAKMKIAPQDRPKVRLECLRLLATLKLDPAKSQLIGGFIGTYLRLNAEEMKQYEQEFAKLTPEEKEANMELMNPWVKQGWEDGKQAGIKEALKLMDDREKESIQKATEELVTRQIKHRFGSVSAAVTERLNRLSSEQLNELGLALLDFKTSADLETWLSRHHAQ